MDTDRHWDIQGVGVQDMALVAVEQVVGAQHDLSFSNMSQSSLGSIGSIVAMVHPGNDDTQSHTQKVLR